MRVSALILTLNEEINLPKCLDSLKWCDDVVLLDSNSTDGTKRIADKSGCRFIVRQFDDYASQRNFGINEIKFKYPWVVMVDADEVMPSELCAEIASTLKNDNIDMCLYRMRRKDYFMGRWIRRSSGYPTWFGRLARVGHVRVKRRINEEYHTDGKVGYLEHHLLHFPFNKGFHSWIEKHNRYSDMEAELLVSTESSRIRLSDVFHTDPTVRRKQIKALLYMMPMRPLWVFAILFFLKLGFLDGKAGFTYCTLKAFYEYLIDCKVKELKLRQRGLSI